MNRRGIIARGVIDQAQQTSVIIVDQRHPDVELRQIPLRMDGRRGQPPDIFQPLEGLAMGENDARMRWSSASNRTS